jgi:anti-anti-sigma factor
VILRQFLDLHLFSWYNKNARSGRSELGGESTVNIEIKAINRALLVKVTGEIIGLNIIKLQKIFSCFLEEGYESAVLDMHEVTAIDSNGLAGLLYTHLQFQKANREFILASLPGEIRDLIFNCNVNRVLNIQQSSVL